MGKNSPETSNEMDKLAEDARDLMAATADVAGEKVGEARQRLAAALDRATDKAVQGAKAVNEAVHKHPYQAIAIGVGVGAILGFCLARRCAGKRG
jgi:ElaB/YqjD/DUF883 family membrane-anchored ribosome-binding protein